MPNKRRRTEEVEVYDKKTLVNECATKNWRGWKRLKKEDLAHFVTRHRQIEAKAARVILRALTSWIKVIKSVVNTLDPLTMDQVLPGQRFLLRQDGHLYQFTIKTLLEYILSSGNKKNPVTGVEMTSKDLETLKKLFFMRYPRDAPLTYRLAKKSYTFTRRSNLWILASIIA